MSSINSKKKIIIIGGSIIFLIIALIISLFVPKIKLDLNGKQNITIEVGSEYKDPGAKATLSNLLNKKNLKVQISGTVNPDKIGKYKITYIAKAKGLQKKQVRTVNVVDTVKPEINIKGDARVCHNNKIFDINATANDNYDGDLTDKIEYHLEKDILYLSVTDSSNNKTEIKNMINYIDNEKPKIELKGNSIIYLNLNEKYTEYGANANDSCDGEISEDIKISGTVDTSKEGIYYIKYEVTDSYGNKVNVSRKIIVQNKVDSQVTDGTIYLTFDDGPGKYTEEILQILDKYNIKATFFVTGQFPKYFDLITKEYNEGHTVGIHTYSHKWTVYESVDAYLEDFNKIENIIYEKTGVHPKYFRFPGGSSNTISRRYCEKIMTNLTELMPQKGYTYFDWTFDSCDTCKNNSKEDILKMVKTYLKGNGDYIILMHDIKKNTKLALPEIIDYALKKGYQFKKIDETTPVQHFKVAN